MELSIWLEIKEKLINWRRLLNNSKGFLNWRRFTTNTDAHPTRLPWWKSFPIHLKTPKCRVENCLQPSQQKSPCIKTRQLLSELLCSKRGSHWGVPTLKTVGSSTVIPAKALGSLHHPTAAKDPETVDIVPLVLPLSYSSFSTSTSSPNNINAHHILINWTDILQWHVLLHVAYNLAVRWKALLVWTLKLITNFPLSLQILLSPASQARQNTTTGSRTPWIEQLCKHPHIFITLLSSSELHSSLESYSDPKGSWSVAKLTFQQEK